MNDGIFNTQVNKMITKEQAIESAREYVLERTKKRKYILLLRPERTMEFELGWVFSFKLKITSNQVIFWTRPLELPQ